uniref:RING finger protein 11 n=1 Tax=Schistocephalus solidus TaxID=70667 RepID=A0A0X3NWA5_SCHSO
MGNCLKRNRSRHHSAVSDRPVRSSSGNSRITAHQWYLENDPILHPAPGLSVRASQLTEEQQIKIAVRMGLIVTLPVLTFDDSKREMLSECVICMCDYELGDELRCLPCMHTFHRACIDDWLMRSLTCPSCLEELKPPPIVTTPPPRTHETAITSQTPTTAITTTTMTSSSAPQFATRSARHQRRGQNNGVEVSAPGPLSAHNSTASPAERSANVGTCSTCSSSLTSTTSSSSTASSNNATYVLSEVPAAPTGSTSDPACVTITSPGTNAPSQRASGRRRKLRPHTSSAYTRSLTGGRGDCEE